MRKEPDCDYSKLNISVIVCDTDTPYRSTKWWWWPQNFRSDDFNLTTRNPSLSTGIFLVISNPLSTFWNQSVLKASENTMSSFGVIRSQSAKNLDSFRDISFKDQW